jgi:hypothetical protein
MMPVHGTMGATSAITDTARTSRGAADPSDWPAPLETDAGSVSSRLDRESPLANNGPALMPVIHIVECPDPDGRRWQRALELLLEAGRRRQGTDSAA